MPPKIDPDGLRKIGAALLEGFAEIGEMPRNDELLRLLKDLADSQSDDPSPPTKD